MHFDVSIQGVDRSFPCRSDQSVLTAMTAARARGVQVGCRSGGCGVCRVRVAKGQYEVGRMSREQISKEQEKQGLVLACQVFPLSDLQIVPIGRLVAAASNDVRTWHRQEEGMKTPGRTQ